MNLFHIFVLQTVLFFTRAKTDNMIYLQSIVPSENRFRHYKIEREGGKVITAWGRNGLQKSMLFFFKEEREAISFVRKRLLHKLKKGYNLYRCPEMSLFRKKKMPHMIGAAL